MRWKQNTLLHNNHIPPNKAAIHLSRVTVLLPHNQVMARPLLNHTDSPLMDRQLPRLRVPTLLLHLNRTDNHHSNMELPNHTFNPRPQVLDMGRPKIYNGMEFKMLRLCGKP
jgi:hypothetical protein